MSELLCACGCGTPVALRSDGKQQRYKKGHSGAGQMVDAVCATCSAPIRVARWRVDRFRFIACSTRCGGIQRVLLAEKALTCYQCGSVFRMKASRKTGNRIFCSLQCFAAANSDAPKPRVAVACSGCSAPLRVFPSKAKMNQHFYCNPACRARHIMGTNNPAYTSGIGRKREYAANWKSRRRATVKRDAGRCRRCHTIPARSRDLHVHHIVPARTFNGDWERANAVANLVTLCLPCHYLVEHGKVALQVPLA